MPFEVFPYSLCEIRKAGNVTEKASYENESFFNNPYSCDHDIKPINLSFASDKEDEAFRIVNYRREVEPRKLFLSIFTFLHCESRDEVDCFPIKFLRGEGTKLKCEALRKIATHARQN